MQVLAVLHLGGTVLGFITDTPGFKEFAVDFKDEGKLVLSQAPAGFKGEVEIYNYGGAELEISFRTPTQYVGYTLCYKDFSEAMNFMAKAKQAEYIQVRLARWDTLPPAAKAREIKKLYRAAGVLGGKKPSYIVHEPASFAKVLNSFDSCQLGVHPSLFTV